ncbi:MAG: electron transport complex subunit E [Gammaproteobacteria bacterium]|nr:electron transport complex subunit E [Gammaproteobacteria bacterium]
MTESASLRTLLDGIWSNNPGLVQFLGLCPLLAVSNTAINGLGLGLATLAVLTLSNLLVSLCRNRVPNEVRLPVFVLIIASLVTVIELLFKAFLFDLYLSLGIFIPLIVTNCAILARAEAFASRHSPSAAILDGISMGAGFILLLVALGALRELIGRGSLFYGADSLFGPMATGFEMQLFPESSGLLLAVLPPGAFIGLGLLVAAKNYFDARAVSLSTTQLQSEDPAQ